MGDTTDSELGLVTRARSGDQDAIATLFERYYTPARQYARRLAADVDPDDVVAEAFIRVIGALRRGKGPDNSFRAYLFTAVRRQVIDQSIRARREAMPQDQAEPGEADSLSERVADSDLVQRALLRLPDRWREVLWRTEVEGLRPDELGAVLGIRSHAAAALAFRAREGFRLALLSESVPGETDPAECAEVRDELPRYVRGSLSVGRRRRVRLHLEDCRRCSAVLVELEDVNRRFRSVTGLIGAGALVPALAATASAGHASAPVATALVRVGRRLVRQVRGSRALHLSVAAAGAAASVALVASSLEVDDDPRRGHATPSSGLNADVSGPPQVLPPAAPPGLAPPVTTAVASAPVVLRTAPAPVRTRSSAPARRPMVGLPAMVPMHRVTPGPGDRPAPVGMTPYCLAPRLRILQITNLDVGCL